MGARIETRCSNCTRNALAVQEDTGGCVPEPYRSNCERALGRRRGILPIRMDAIETSADTVGVGQLMKDFGDLCAAVSPAVADGVIDEKDRPHGQKIINETDDLVISALTFRKAVIRAMGLEQKA